MTANIAIIEPRKSVTMDMAHRYGMEAETFEKTLRATVFPNNGSRETFAAFLIVAREHNLNPITKEIYAFPAKGGGIVPIVSIDGWMKLINSHPQFDGMAFEDTHSDKGDLVATKCTIYRKDRSHPVSVTEYLSECQRPTEPWKMKHRMLRHKSAIQCARYAFSFAGIYDPDEGERILEAQSLPPPPQPPRPPTPPAIPKASNLKQISAPPSAPIPEPKAEGGEAAGGPASPPDAAAMVDDAEREYRDGIVSEFLEAAADARDGDSLDEAWSDFMTPLEAMPGAAEWVERANDAYGLASERLSAGGGR